MPSIQIAAIGTYVPPLRTNDWWSPDVVERWRRAPALASGCGGQLTEGRARVLAAIDEIAEDPFGGARTRGVMPPSMKTSDMEVQAAEDALRRAELAAGDVDILLQQSSGNDFIWPQNACRVADALGLRRDVLSVPVESGADSFILQLTLAAALLDARSMDTALLVQSSAMATSVSPEAPHAPTLGDAATAAVIYRCDVGSAIETAHATDGRFFRAYGVGDDESPWFRSSSPPRFGVIEPATMANLFTGIADMVEAVVAPLLDRVGWQRCDVEFFASHQASPWLSDVLMAHLELDRARTCSTFEACGSANASNLPLVLERAIADRLLHRGDRVVLVSGGAGSTCSAAALVWS